MGGSSVGAGGAAARGCPPRALALPPQLPPPSRQHKNIAVPFHTVLLFAIVNVGSYKHTNIDFANLINAKNIVYHTS